MLRCLQARKSPVCSLRSFVRPYSNPASSEELSQALLNRASKLSRQYTELTRQSENDTDFTPEVAIRQKKMSELELPHQIFCRWQDHTQDMKELQKLLDDTKESDMQELAREDIASAEEESAELAASLKKALMPVHPQSELPALIEIRSGIGGDEANIFANDLLKMYERFAAAMHWQVRPYSISRTEIGDGVTEAIIAISGPNAFGQLKAEAGVHRVQRTPATETKGRTHTSTVSINVLPEIDDSREESEYEKLDMAEIKLEVMRSRGAGGQHVNRTESAVRLTHIPTGITISMQDSRSQHANKRAAFAILRSKLSALRREKEAEVQVGLRRSQVSSSDRSEKIRTYNYAQSRVTDHRCGYTSHDLEGIMAGTESLGYLMNEVNQWSANLELQRIMEEEEEVGKSSSTS